MGFFRNSKSFYLIAKFPDEHQEEYDENTNSWYKIKDKLLGYLNDELLSNYIVMLGYRHDYLNIMAALDIVVNCNRLGSIGRQAFETMAVGTLCIATHRNPETTRLIINNKNGYIVKEGDILHMIELIIKLYKNKVELENIALNGMKYAHQEFSSKIQTNKIQLIYNQILNR
jgi:glycosyltransferase involved in cell wall biosynthesis